MGLRDDATAAAVVTSDQLTEMVEAQVEPEVAAWCERIGVAEVPVYTVAQSAYLSPRFANTKTGLAFCSVSFDIDGLTFTGTVSGSVYEDAVGISNLGVQYEGRPVETLADLGELLR